MPNFGPITINDGQATPVAHTFNPLTLQSGVAEAVDQSGGQPIGYPRLTRSLRAPTGNGNVSSSSRVYRVRFRIKVPVLEALGTSDSGLTPPPTKSHENYVDIEFVIAERSSQAEREDLLAYAQNLLAHAETADMVESLEAIY